jgi:hypothetical protein
MLVLLEVWLQIIDRDSQQGDLYFRGTGITGSTCILCDNSRFILSR